MGVRAAKKTMLAKQVLQEINAGGRVSKKSQLAFDATDRDASTQDPTRGVDLSNMREAILRLVPSGLDTVTMGKLPQTPGVKKVIEYAIKAARNLNHKYVGTEHLLLGLLRHTEGTAAIILLNLGCKLEDIRAETLRLLAQHVNTEGRGLPPTGIPTDNLGYQHFTEQVRRVMQLANQEAQHLNHGFIGTEHILLGLMKEGTGIAAQVLNRLAGLLI